MRGGSRGSARTPDGLRGKELEEAVKIISLEYQADPKLMHVLSYVGGFIKVKLENVSDNATGPFHVEFYVTNGEDMPEKLALPLYGGRVFVNSLPGQADAVVRVDMSARCPLGAKTGEAKLWAGIRALSHDEVPNNFTDLCKRALEGSRTSIFNLADVTWHGQAGVSRDLREALRWYHKIQGTTTPDGHVLAQLAWTELHVMICGPIPMDLAPLTKVNGLQRAWLTYALSIDQRGEGDPKPLSAWEMELVGEGFEIIPEKGEAASWMYLAAEDGDLPQAQLNLAVWYAHGHHVPRSIPQAWYWFKRAADKGLPDAKYQLGILHQKGEGVEHDLALAAKLFQAAVNQGHVPSHLSLGVCYLEGTGVDQDKERAVRLLHVPARAGMPVAQFNLGCLYAWGEGVEKDLSEAAMWYLRASQQGHGEARICYAMALYKGEGVAQDLVQSAELFLLAASKGHKQAQYNIGVMYARGEGVEQSREEAAKWWELSADQGHGFAQLELGQYHMKLAQEAVASSEDLILTLIKKLCTSRELFDKFITADRFKTGFGQVRRPLTMDNRLFCQLLEKTVQIVPSKLTREVVYHLISNVNQQFSYEEKQFGYDMFLEYMREVCKHVDLQIDGIVFESSRDDVWMTKKREVKKSRDADRVVRLEKELTVKEMSDTKTLLDAMRGIPPPKAIRLSDAQRRIRQAELEIETMREQVRKENGTLKFLQWRQQESKERFVYCKQMADGLGQRMKIQESNQMHREAERFRKDGERVSLLMSRQHDAIKRAEKKVNKAIASKAKAEAIVGETVGHFEMAEEHDAEEAEALLAHETAKVGKGKEEAEASRMEHMERAAQLFLQAAEQGLVEAQVVVADMYISGGKLPESWVPKSEADLPARDRMGLLQFRALLDNAKQRRREKEREKFVEFSFQGDVERRVHQKVEEDKQRKIQEAMKEFSHVKPPTDQNHPGYALYMRAVSANTWHPERDDSSQMHKEFEQWYAKRCRQERAAYWFMQAANGGHAGAQYQVGMMHLRGFEEDDDPLREGSYVPLPLDRPLAVQWLERAARADHAEAMCELGMCLLRGIGTDVDMESSRTWFEKSAAKGVPEGMYQLGLCYERGKGVRPDAKRAVAYYRQAAELGLVNAQVALAICLERGEGVEQNEKEAVEWYRRAGEQSSEAQYLLGKCLEDGRGVTKDHRQAAALFGAAAATHATAQLQLGVAYQYGIGVRQDPAEAFHCFLRAASQGSSEAALNVALCYSSGTGVPEDIPKYHMWLQKASAAGSLRASEMLSIQSTEGSRAGAAKSPAHSRSPSRIASRSLSRLSLSRSSM